MPKRKKDTSAARASSRKKGRIELEGNENEISDKGDFSRNEDNESAEENEDIEIESEEETQNSNSSSMLLRLNMVNGVQTERKEAEVGIVEWVHLKNFMCHGRLNITLGPHVNFIIGRNGSGKSAVVTALIVGMGGKASVTNRGSTVKSFIKSGKKKMLMTCTVQILITKLPKQWQGLFILMSKRRPYHKLLSTWYKRSEPETKMTWDSLLMVLVYPEPVVKEKCLHFWPLLACFGEVVVVKFFELLLKYEYAVSPDSLYRFLSTVHLTMPTHILQAADDCYQKLWNCISKQNGCFESHGENLLKENQQVMPTTGMSSEYKIKPRLENIVNKEDFSFQTASIPQVASTCLNDECFTVEPGLTVDQCSHKDANDSIILIESDEISGTFCGQKTKGKEQEKEQPCLTEGKASGVLVTGVCKMETNQTMFSSEDMMKLQRIRETWLTGNQEVPSEISILTLFSSSQICHACEILGVADLPELSLITMAEHVSSLTKSLSTANCIILLEFIIEKKLSGLESSASRQFIGCLSRLSAAFPTQLITVLCTILTKHPPNTWQGEVIANLSKTLDSKTLPNFLSELCHCGVKLEENVITIVQSIVEQHPELNPSLLKAMVTWLEMAATLQANSPKFGRLLLTLIKAYRVQFNSGCAGILRVIVDSHKSFTRRSLMQVLKTLPS